MNVASSVGDHDLAEERLGRGDADLRPDAQVDAGVGLARDRRADDVHDAQRQRTALLRLLQRGERVGRLARLADRDDDRAVLDDRVAVAELAGVLDLGRDLREVLDEVLADHRRVQRRALADEA